jgi:hypothetical protein
MKRFLIFALAVAMLLITGILTLALGEAIVTLKSGEVLKGDILSDTNGVLQIRAYNYNRTISSRRDVPRSDIQDLQNETPIQAAERIDYFALSKFQLDPDQEQSVAWYSQWIAAFDKFKKNYPESDKIALIQENIDVCRAELKHVSNGEAKFENKWMTPAEKRPQAINKQLAALHKQQDELTLSLAQDQGQLSGLQDSLPNLRDQWQLVDHVIDVDDGSPNHYHSKQHNFVRELVPNPDRPAAQANIVRLQQKLSKDQAAMLILNARMQSLENRVSQGHPQASQPHDSQLASPQPIRRPSSPVHILSRDEFHSHAIGMHSSDLLNYVGKPDSTQEGTYSRSVWYYRHLTQDPANGQWDLVQVVFNDDVVSAIEF